ncbi:MAG: glycoside hydrolase family protein [Terriglobales bacterium]
MPITNLEDQLRRDEDDRGFAYDDATGKTLLKEQTLLGNLTIGVGHNLSAKPLSKNIRDLILHEDMAEAEAALAENWPWALDLDDTRKGAMLNLVFNMGAHALSGFKNFLAAMQRGDWMTAKDELLSSAADHQEPQRIGRLAAQIETGVWQ